MTEYLIEDPDGYLIEIDGGLLVQDDEDGYGPIETRPPYLLCCPCQPPAVPWAFGSCLALTTQRAVLTTPDISYDWTMETISPSLAVCGSRFGATFFSPIPTQEHLTIAAMTTDNVDPTTSAFTQFFNPTTTPLDWNGFAVTFGPVANSYCPPAWESFLNPDGCGVGTEFRPDPVATNEPGVHVVAISRPFTSWAGVSVNYNTARHFDANTIGYMRLGSVEAFIPARTGFTTWRRESYFIFGVGAGTADVEGDAFVISQG